MNLRLRESQTYLEYHLSTATLSSEGEDGNGKDGQTSLVWSASKSIPKTKSQTGNTNIGGSITRAVVRKIIHMSNKSRQLCQDLFLPIGYPNSVAEGYLEYQFYDSLQGLCSYLRGVVATSAVLSATGVGNAEATAMSAAMTWAVRDGLGMIGGLLFSYVASPHFDAHVKEFRLLADVLNDVGLTLDMALPLILTWVSSSSSPSWSDSLPIFFGPWYSTISFYLPSLYLVLTSASTLCKVACGMAAGATKGNITDHFAISGNRADCQSKESTQETLVSLVGMCCGIWMAHVLHRLEKIGKGNHDIGTCIDGEVDDDGGGVADTCANNAIKTMAVDVQFISWTVFVILTLVHVWANFVGMQMLRLRTLNRERAKVALQSLVEVCGLWVLENQNKNNDDHCKVNHNESISQKAKTPTSQANTSKKLVIDKVGSRLLSPKSVSESLWKSMCGMALSGNVHLGIRLTDLVLRSSPSKRKNTTYKSSWGQWDGENYMIFIDRDQRNENKKSNMQVIVMLRVGANERDELKAFLHAHILEWLMQHESHYHSTKLPKLLSRSYEMIQYLFQPSSIAGTIPDQSSEGAIDIYNILGEKGWDMTRLYLGFDPHRCEWEADAD